MIKDQLKGGKEVCNSYLFIGHVMMLMSLRMREILDVFILYRRAYELVLASSIRVPVCCFGGLLTFSSYACSR